MHFERGAFFVVREMLDIVVPSDAAYYSMFVLILQVGTCRALHSKCHPRHFFIPKVRSRNAAHVAKAAKLPLRAIVYLAQAPENRIEDLKGFSAFRNVWEGCSLHTWDREDLSLASDCVLKILQRVPVFHLRCRPDEGAVDTLYSVLHDRGCI